jgi:hypothetical protein
LDDCWFVCAGLYRLHTVDQKPPGSAPPWLENLPSRNALKVDARSSNVYHWDWGSEEEIRNMAVTVEPPFSAGDIADIGWTELGDRREWAEYAREQIRWSIGWHRVGLDETPPRLRPGGLPREGAGEAAYDSAATWL